MRTFIINNLQPMSIVQTLYYLRETFPFFEGYCFKLNHPRILLVDYRSGEYAFESRGLLRKQYRIKFEVNEKIVTMEIEKKDEKIIFTFEGKVQVYSFRRNLFVCVY